MNELLAQDAEVMAECNALDRDYVIAYKLVDGLNLDPPAGDRGRRAVNVQMPFVG